MSLITYIIDTVKQLSTPTACVAISNVLSHFMLIVYHQIIVALHNITLWKYKYRFCAKDIVFIDGYMLRLRQAKSY